MFERYRGKIEQYCNDVGIEIPIGFHRHDACRYVAIDHDVFPPKLIAMTWSSEEDVVKSLMSNTVGQNVRLLDFEDRRELTFNDRSRLVKGAPF